MMGRFGVLAVAAVLLIAPLAQSAQLLLVDSKDHSYLRTRAGDAAPSLDQQGLSALLSALSGLVPPSAIGPELSHTIDAILKPSPLVRPAATVVLNVAGLSAGEVAGLFSARHHAVVDIDAAVGTSTASTVINAVMAVAASNLGAELLPLEPLALLQGCGAACLQEHLDALVSAVDTELISLDIRRPGAQRLFALELANALAGTRAHLRTVASREAPQESEVLEVTLLGLHPLATLFGADSREMEVAKAVVLNVLRLLAAELDLAYQGDVAYHISLLDSVPDAHATMKELLGWKENRRKQLMQMRGLQAATTFPGPDEAANAKSFTIKACAFGAFLLLLYFAMAAVHCMCNMPFKADSMLFGRTKAD